MLKSGTRQKPKNAVFEDEMTMKDATIRQTWIRAFACRLKPFAVYFELKKTNTKSHKTINSTILLVIFHEALIVMNGKMLQFGIKQSRYAKQKHRKVKKKNKRFNINNNFIC